jgi:hypothetical protein
VTANDTREASYGRARRLVAFAALAIALGAALRFAWPADMEFKADERTMFEQSQRIGASEPWPALGMVSGVGLRNPGMSVWLFVALARVLRVTTPTGLALAVMALNVVALVLLFAFALGAMRGREREAWLWAVALAAVNPLAVVIQRKIWAQSVLPLFALVFWIGWWRRERWGRAFAWGLVGALLGQVHMSGLFFAAGVAGWEWLAGPRAPGGTGSSFVRPRWAAWLAGSLLGALPMIPWIAYVFHAPPSDSAWQWRQVVTPNFWIYGLTDALGLGLQYNLGLASFGTFLRYPLVSGTPTFLVALAHAFIVLAASGVLAPALAQAWGQRRVWRSEIRGRSATRRALAATFLAFGVLLTLSGRILYRHYLVVTFPLEWVFIAGLALTVPHGRRLLAVLWGSQLVITTAFLFYIHANGGAPGDYGTSYRHQLEAGVSGRIAP